MLTEYIPCARKWQGAQLLGEKTDERVRKTNSGSSGRRNPDRCREQHARRRVLGGGHRQLARRLFPRKGRRLHQVDGRPKTSVLENPSQRSKAACPTWTGGIFCEIDLRR